MSSKELHRTEPVVPHYVWYNDNTWQLCIQCTFTAGFTNREKMAMMDAMRVVTIIWEDVMIQDIWITSHNFLQCSPIFLGQDLRFLPWNEKIRIFFAFCHCLSQAQWRRDAVTQREILAASLRLYVIARRVLQWACDLGLKKSEKMHYIFSNTSAWKNWWLFCDLVMMP